MDGGQDQLGRLTGWDVSDATHLRGGVRREEAGERRRDALVVLASYRAIDNYLVAMAPKPVPMIAT
jgi:hypothetical protein